MLFGDRVAPLDLQGRVDQDDAVGQGADRAAKALLVVDQAPLADFARAVPAMQPREHLGPDAKTVRDVV
jgi:hypothetical protein